MRRLSLLLLLLACAASAHAQDFLAYGTFSSAHLSDVNTTYTVAGIDYTTQTSGMWIPSLGLGVTLNFAEAGPVTFGSDFRFTLHGSDSFGGFFGLKLTIAHRDSKLKPYTELLIGYLRYIEQETTIYSPVGDNTDTHRQSALAFAILGGVDYQIAHHFDVRMLELGIGGVNKNFLFDSSTHALFTLNSGIVFHF